MSFTTLRRRVAGHDGSEVLEPLRPESVVELTDEDLANVTGAGGHEDHGRRREEEDHRHRREEEDHRHRRYN